MKKYKIVIQKNDRERIVEVTLEGLIDYFGYTLEIGASWDKRVNQKPKTIRSFMTNIQRAFEAKEACCYQRTFIKLIT